MHFGLLLENIFRDSKHGAALRHLPSGSTEINTCWMWASLIAAAIAAWLHQLTGLISGGELAAGHGVRGGKAMILPPYADPAAGVLGSPRLRAGTFGIITVRRGTP